jgi:hypothetical protein
MHGLPGNAGERHLTGEMKNNDVAAFRHHRIRKRFRVIRRQRLTRRVISLCAIEPTKFIRENPQTALGCPDASHVLIKAMIDSIRAWISGNSPDHRKETGARQEALQLALTALLVEAANSDDRFDEAERDVISRLLESRFSLSRSMRMSCSPPARQRLPNRPSCSISPGSSTSGSRLRSGWSS